VLATNSLSPFTNPAFLIKFCDIPNREQIKKGIFNTMDNQRVVNFAESLNETMVYEEDLNSQERNTICWYSNAELLESRLGAKRAILLLLRHRGNVAQAQEAASGQEEEITFRGLEKFANAHLCQLRKKKFVIQSVLLRQMEHGRRVAQGRRTVCLKEELAAVSKRLSEPCAALAHFHASKSIQEDKDYSSFKGDENKRKSSNELGHTRSSLVIERWDGSKRRRVITPDTHLVSSARYPYNVMAEKCDATIWRPAVSSVMVENFV
jgi:hypothetical protein